MTYHWRLMAILLVVALGVPACNDDTSSSPTGPVDDEQPVVGDDVEPANSEDDATVFFGELNQAMSDVIPLLLFGGGELQGSGGGRVVVEGTTMTFEEYFPDGQTAMTGVIVIEILETHWTIDGTLTRSGSNEGEVLGTIDGTEYDVAELSAERLGLTFAL